ncbi:nephrin-like [Saccoglossus kowalevskii]
MELIHQARTSPVIYSPVFSRDDAEVPFNCKISHGTLADAVTCEDVITFDVQYPPDLKIDVEPRYKDGQIKEGEDFFASCNVISSNPRTDNVAWTSLLDNFQVDPNNPLEILSITRDKAGEYMCSAENTYYDGTTGNTEEIITIDVQYIPVVVLDESKTVKEGDAVSINCSTFITEANPAASEFQWIRNSAVEQTTDELTIYSVARSDAGLYSCWAFNYFYDGSPGKGESTTELVVQYGPEVSLESPLLPVTEGSKVTINCTVDSQPPPFKYEWTQIMKDGTVNELGEDMEYLSFASVDRSKGGNYTCKATTKFYDDMDEDASASAELVIHYSPDIVDAVDKVAVDKDEMAVLVCKSDAFPDPQFKWLNSTGGELTSDVEGLQIAEKYEDNLFISTLTIKKVNSAKDYGRYDCMAYNEIGTKSLQIELVPITIPEKPTITETSVSDTTIAVTWTSGFNGGRPQTFTVKYQNLETLDEAKSTEMKDDGSESYTYTIEGLKADTEYAVWVLATNTKGEQEVKSSALKTDSK